MKNHNLEKGNQGKFVLTSVFTGPLIYLGPFEWFSKSSKPHIWLWLKVYKLLNDEGLFGFPFHWQWKAALQECNILILQDAFVALQCFAIQLEPAACHSRLTMLRPSVIQPLPKYPAA